MRCEATTFRYAHGLISAADFRRWLEVRELTVADVSGVLRRRLLRGQLHAPASAEGGGLNGVLRAEAHCDGVLRRLVEVAIEWLAAAALTGAATSPADDRGRLDEAIGRARALRGEAISELDEVELNARMTRVLELQQAHERLRCPTPSGSWSPPRSPHSSSSSARRWSERASRPTGTTW